MPNNKTDNFLRAIKRYANAQKRALKGEVEQLKNERLKEAEATAKRDSERMKKEKLAETRNRVTAKRAKITQEGQRKLFLERSSMTTSKPPNTAKSLKKAPRLWPRCLTAATVCCISMSATLILPVS